ncbi:hypothetical protein VTL71DRAFT_14111 [Oculimacula yallundae]|uniref:Uncharacterized protein n=1 Tax=Oculimacula yallundae TaxID=86028 RepID=A0ABR4CI90_9HELO
MSLSNLSMSMVTAKQETNLGLFNINIDFSLVKVDPPREFLQLGNEISASRRHTAEVGQPHITARKLGALFQQWLPRTPHLIRAYGTRASEIAASPDIKLKGDKALYGLFAEHVGIDATSVWAAATSGPDAIAMHLLACVLARIWPRAEATAIWAQIVDERKKELEAVDTADPLYHISRQLARITVSREQLKEWDSSARAWIQTADQVMQVKQTQLMLILNNMTLPVNSNPKLFQNVLQTWKSAMITVDNLIQGMPHSVETAAALLGLCSWHIYPDMLVLHNSPTPVRQNDPLVPKGGILTVGLQIERPGQEGGVYWSLPLGHLRYYGAPVVMESHLETEGGRIEVDQLLQVAFGSFSIDSKCDRSKLGAFVVRFAKACSDADMAVPWLDLLAHPLRPLVEGDEIARKRCEQLMRLGAMRCRSFILHKSKIPSIFGLTTFDNLLPLLQWDSAVSLVRQWATGNVAEHKNRCIVIVHHHGEDIEIATVIPNQESSTNNGHMRWLSNEIAVLEQRQGVIGSRGETVAHIERSDIVDSAPHVLHWKNPPLVLREKSQNFKKDESSQEAITMKFRIVAGKGERITVWAYNVAPTNKVWRFVSDSDCLEALSTALEDGNFQVEQLSKYLVQFPILDDMENLRRSIRALATVKSVYGSIPSAKISLDVTSLTLHKMAWLPDKELEKFSELASQPTTLPFQLSRSEMFSCIALFESGRYVVSPKSLTSVMAMAAGDSIYISAPLLCDPADSQSSSQVHRVTGSIGKPGIAMLIPPQNPQVSEYDKADWQMVNHDTFDGCEQDSFQGTTLHLGFTGYVLPIDTGQHGSRDSEIYFLESVVSVHEHGKWIADLDILGQFRDRSRYRVLPSCTHTRGLISNVIPTSSITAIDHFSEIVDPPEFVGIIRSSKNWLARLAVATISLQLDHPTVILSDRFCWDCILESWVNAPSLSSTPPIDNTDSIHDAALSSVSEEFGSSDASGEDMTAPDRRSRTSALRSHTPAASRIRDHGLRRTSRPRGSIAWSTMTMEEKIADMSGLLVVC